VGYLLLTIVLGASFLGIKAYEYSLEFGENLFPGPGFSFEHHAAGLDVRRVELFFFLYFFMTSLHALHMIIGLVIIGIIAAAIWLGGCRPRASGRSRSRASTGTSSTSSGSSSIPCST
jgi:cytochrome c oxidase subunit 3